MTLSDTARTWLANDPDPQTRAELEALLAQDPAKTDLADRFVGSLEFGTAGLRGIIGAGPNRMNRAVILRTTWGLGKKLLASGKGIAERGVVIGYDGRTLSREFAEETAAVLAALGIRAHLFQDLAPTPLTAFAVKYMKAAAGVMVTASHNPPEYNGYKVYWGNGAQIIPPIDHEIATWIDQAPVAKDVPKLSEADSRGRGLLWDVKPEVEGAYLDTVCAVIRKPQAPLKIVYTAMHGVGGKLATLLFNRAGFPLIPVPEQFAPDGRFPTVRFPNPEEKGAMDLSMALATKESADLVLANDPDADRLAVAVPGPNGKYVQLTGNQVGVLLGHYLLTSRPLSDKALVLASLVSSPELGALARTMGVRYEETLTGFKWLANRAMDLEKEGYRTLFAYEEALGYSIFDLVRDKDGISAALLMAELVSVLKSRGDTLLTELDAISEKYGVFVSDQISITKPGAAGVQAITAIMTKLRNAPPTKLAGLAVMAVSDLESGVRKEGTVTSQLAFQKSNVLVFDLEGGSRVVARPSGTEPKIKFYFDVRESVITSVSDARARALETMTNAKQEFSALVS